jgi:hypothetical protein
LYAAEGDWGNAGISSLGIIPGLGDAAKAGRMGKRAKDLAEEWLPSNALYNRGGSKAPRHIEDLLPAEPHLQIPKRKGIYQGTSVDLILEDLGQLRQRFPDIPQSVLDELSELIRRSLGADS